MVAALLLFCSCGAEISLRKGDQSYALGEYTDAAARYKKAYAGTPAKEKELRGKIAFKLGESYRHISYAPRAIAAYQNAVRYKYPDSIVYRHLADMQRKEGKFKDAEKDAKGLTQRGRLIMRPTPAGIIVVMAAKVSKKHNLFIVLFLIRN